MRVFEVEPGKSLNKCMEKDLESVLTWLEEADTGDEITIRVKEMSLKEYEALPEYTGP